VTGWVEVASERRGVLVEMFAAWPGLHGCIAAVLEGGMGRAFAYWISPTAQHPDRHCRDRLESL